MSSARAEMRRPPFPRSAAPSAFRKGACRPVFALVCFWPLLLLAPVAVSCWLVVSPRLRCCSSRLLVVFWPPRRRRGPRRWMRGWARLAGSVVLLVRDRKTLLRLALRRRSVLLLLAVVLWWGGRGAVLCGRRGVRGKGRRGVSSWGGEDDAWAGHGISSWRGVVSLASRGLCEAVCRVQSCWEYFARLLTSPRVPCPACRRAA